MDTTEKEIEELLRDYLDDSSTLTTDQAVGQIRVWLADAWDEGEYSGGHNERNMSGYKNPYLTD